MQDQFANAVGIIGFVRQHDGAGVAVIEQRVGDLSIMSLPCGQAWPDRVPCASTTAWIFVVSPPRDLPRQ
jgi:hypothetical protein